MTGATERGKFSTRYEQLSAAALLGSLQGQGKAFPSQHRSLLCPPWGPGCELEAPGLCPCGACLCACPCACLASRPRPSSPQSLPPSPTQNWAAGGASHAPGAAGSGGPLPVKLTSIICPKAGAAFLVSAPKCIYPSSNTSYPGSAMQKYLSWAENQWSWIMASSQRGWW